MVNYTHPTAQPEYHGQFWDMVRKNTGKQDYLSRGYNTSNGTYTLPTASSARLDKAIDQESIFRTMGTFISAYGHSYRIFAKDSDDLATFIPEGEEIPIYEDADEFNINTVDFHKAAVFLKMDEDFVRDAAFDIEGYLVKRLAKNFGRAEERACITGNGVSEPVGILHENDGAEVGKTTSELSYDDVVELYFSVKPEYCKHGTWLMNDKTALALRKIKDADGNYIWNHNNDTILGKPVQISEFMPDVEAGKKAIAFGDFSYYWFISRSPVSLRTLTEKFAIHDQVGYLALEFLDGKLIRKDAVKVLQIGA